MPHPSDRDTSLSSVILEKELNGDLPDHGHAIEKAVNAQH